MRTTWRCILAADRQIEREEYPGKKVDWGAWPAQVSKQQIRDFIEEHYRGHDWYTDPTLMPHLYTQMRELRDFVESLPDDGCFVLVASEF